MNEQDNVPEIEKSRADIEKVRAETAKLLQDTALAKRNLRLERIKAIGAFTTAIVALVGVFLTFRAQQDQLLQQQQQMLQARDAQEKQISEQRQTQDRQLTEQRQALTRQIEQQSQALSTQLEEQRKIQEVQLEEARRHDTEQSYLALVKQFGESSTPARLGALSGLEQFLTHDKGTFHVRVVALLVSSIEVEESSAVRDLAAKILVRVASVEVVEHLRRQSLDLQRQLADLVGTGGKALRSWERDKGDTQEVTSIRLKQTWNGRTLVEALNTIHRRQGELFGLDLSGVAFAFPVVGQSGPADLPRFIQGLRFRKVNLEGAKLSWLVLDSCEFVDTDLTRAILVSTQFNACKFSGSTSIADFRWTYSFGRSATENVTGRGPIFHTCRLDVQEFGPAFLNYSDLVVYDKAARIVHYASFHFVDTSWTIKNTTGFFAYHNGPFLPESHAMWAKAELGKEPDGNTRFPDIGRGHGFGWQPYPPDYGAQDD